MPVIKPIHYVEGVLRPVIGIQKDTSMLTSNRCVSLKSLQRIVSMFFVFCILPTVAVGQVWSGLGSDNLWGNAGNWVGGTLPAFDDSTDLSFGPSANQFDSLQDVRDPLTLNSIAIDASAGDFTFGGQSLSFEGFDARVSVSGSATAATFNNDWILVDSLSLSASQLFEGTAHNGTISGSGDIAISTDFTINGELNTTGEIEQSINTTLELNGSIGGSGLFFPGRLRGTGSIGNRMIQLNRTNLGSAATLTFDASNDIEITGTAVIEEGTVNFDGAVDWLAGIGSGTLAVRGDAKVGGDGSLNLIRGGMVVQDNAEILASQKIFLGGINRPALQMRDNAVIHSDIDFVDGRLIGRDNARVTGLIRAQAGSVGFIGDIGVFGGTNDHVNNLIIDGTVLAESNIRFEGGIHGSGSLIGLEGSNTSFRQSTVASSLTVSLEGTTTLNESTINADIFIGNGNLTFLFGGNVSEQSIVNGQVTIGSEGTLNGNGIINGQVLLDGEIAPGNSAGTLEIDGNLVLADTAMTSVEIGGTIAGTEYDQIRGGVDGNSTVQLDGVLDIAFIEGFTADVTDTFLIFDNFSFTGQFSNTINGRIRVGENSFAINYGGGGLNRSSTSGITLSDYRFVAVPEPAALPLASLLAFVLGTRRRRKA